VAFCALDDDLEPDPQPGWIAGGAWRTIESPLARTSPHVWSIVGTGIKGEASLLLPVIAASPGSVLEFWHTFDLAPGRSGGVLEGSGDGGTRWVDLGPRISEGGYTAFLLPGSSLEGRRAWTGGALGSMTRVRVPLGDLASGGEVLVRLRWASASAEGVWLLDDVKVCHPVGESGFLGFSASAYACATQATLQLADSGLVGAGHATAQVTSTSSPGPLEVEMVEVATGFFRGSLLLTSAPAQGLLLARDGDSIQAVYVDANSGGGAPGEVRAAAAVDCRPPLIRNPRTGGGAIGTAEVIWETDERAVGRVLHGRACESLGAIALGPGLSLAHTVEILGIDPEVPLLLRIEAVDAAGNSTTFPASGCAHLVLERDCGFEDSLEPPLPGWAHSAEVGPDDWEVVGFAGSRSPTRSWHAKNLGVLKDASLRIPPVDIEASDVLTFWHTFEFEDGFDGALLEISTDGGSSWTSLGASIVEGGYNGSVFVPGGGSTPGWTEGGLGPMTPVRVALDEFVGPERRIRFRIICDESVGTPGWFIDEVSVCKFVSASTGSRFTRGNCNADATVNLSDAIFTLNHLFLGGPDPACRRACDSDDNDVVNLTDAIYLLNRLFLGGRPLPPPDGCAALLAEGAVECERDSCVEG
jgi:hypothetical protein